MQKIVFILLIFVSGTMFAKNKAHIGSENNSVFPSANTTTISPTAPVIKFKTTVHDFGNVKKGSSVTYKFKFKNTGKEPLIISNCRSGCECIFPVFPTKPIKPGKTGFVEIHYDSLRVGIINKEVVIYSNATKPSVNLIIKGNIISEEVEGTDSPSNTDSKSSVKKQKH